MENKYYCSYLQDWVPPCIDDCPMRDSNGICFVGRAIDVSIYNMKNEKEEQNSI